MGLPSGLLWASCNVGAERPSEPGLYFSWGNTEGHAEGSGYDFSQVEYRTTPAEDISTNLSLEQDAARAYLGEPWRMPSAAEFQELYDNCSCVFTTMNGVSGLLFTSNVNGQTLFFPAAGDYNGTTLGYFGISGLYWSSTYKTGTTANYLLFSRSNINPQNVSNRYYGFSVRAVMTPL